MTKTAKQRAQRIAYQAAMSAKALPTIPIATLKQILDLEAAKPLRGGNAELTANGLFGDGMKQGAMF
jgi:hypothetical protein